LPFVTAPVAARMPSAMGGRTKFLPVDVGRARFTVIRSTKGEAGVADGCPDTLAALADGRVRKPNRREGR
jgi:hypothetical protein